MAVLSKANDTLIHKKHACGKVLAPGRSCAITVNLVEHVNMIQVDFRKYFPGIKTWKTWLSESEPPKFRQLRFI